MTLSRIADSESFDLAGRPAIPTVYDCILSAYECGNILGLKQTTINKKRRLRREKQPGSTYSKRRDHMVRKHCLLVLLGTHNIRLVRQLVEKVHA